MSKLQQTTDAPWKAELDAACGKDGLSAILKLGASKLPYPPAATTVAEECGGDGGLIGF